MKALVKRIFLFCMWYPFRALIRVLPLPVTYVIGIVAGRLLCLVSSDRQKVMAQELALVFPDKGEAEIGRMVRDSFVLYCLSEIEVLLYPVLNRERIEKMVTFEGREHLDAALDKGKGVLLLQAHFGAFQMVMPAIGYSGYTMNQISASAAVWKEASDSTIQKKGQDIKADYEYSLPVKHISVTSSLRPVFRALAANEIVGITVDGGGGRKNGVIRFFNRPANFQLGAADLAMRTGAELVPAFIITERWLRHRLVIHPAISVPENGDREEVMREVMQRFAGLIEQHAATHPCHYGYTLFMRRVRATVDEYPFFLDHRQEGRA